MTPNFTKIIHQVSPFGGHGHEGLDKEKLYRISKTLLTPADRFSGVGATFTESAPVEISGIIYPFMAKRWGSGVTENYADLVLSTNIELTYDEADDTANDEIDYQDVRYRIVTVRHNDNILYDDHWVYALKRKLAQIGGP